MKLTPWSLNIFAATRYAVPLSVIRLIGVPQQQTIDLNMKLVMFLLFLLRSTSYYA